MKQKRKRKKKKEPKKKITKCLNLTLECGKTNDQP